MSHKTLYIDVDEEITSIIDRVRKSSASEVIIIAPKQAMLLQSLVNLKLLKKETTRRKKKLMIVTQDKIGKKLIEKAGILVQGKVDGDFEENAEDEITIKKNEPLIIDEEFEKEIEDKEGNLDVGSDQYFDEPLPKPKPEVPEKTVQSSENIGKISFGEKEQPEELEIKPSKQPEIREKVRLSDIVAGPKQKAGRTAKNKDISPEAPDPMDLQNITVPERPKKFDRAMQKKAERFFTESVGAKISPASGFRREKKGEKILKTGRVSRKSSGYFIFFAIIFFLLASVAGAFYFLPKATIALALKNQEKPVSDNIEASPSTASTNISAKTIPAKLEEITKETSQEFKSSGSKNGGGKASGTIVIYNEFSADNQPLVATTRFESPDGKIFRLKNPVTVPGNSKIGNETKSGAISADVIADAPGADFNIEATTFKIPGFAGSPKYDKFYAKSSETMGGGAEGETPVITAQDIAGAKEGLLAAAKKNAVRELESSLPANRKIFEDIVTTELVDAKPSSAAGTQTDNFTFTIKMKASALSFSEDDVKEILKNDSIENDSSAAEMTFQKPISYVLSDSGQPNTSLKFEARSDLEVASSLDIENFKIGALGKNADELETFAKTYPAVQKANVNFWPFFVTRVPMNERRIDLELK